MIKKSFRKKRIKALVRATRRKRNAFLYASKDAVHVSLLEIQAKRDAEMARVKMDVEEFYRTIN